MLLVANALLERSPSAGEAKIQGCARGRPLPVYGLCQADRGDRVAAREVEVVVNMSETLKYVGQM